MRIALTFTIVISLFTMAAMLGGCQSDPDMSNAPNVADVNNGLKGQPAIDPSKSAGMGGGMRKGTAPAPTAPSTSPTTPDSTGKGPGK